MRILKNAMELYGETSNVVLGPSPAYPFKIEIITVANNYKRYFPQRIVDIVKPKNDWYIDVDRSDILKIKRGNIEHKRIRVYPDPILRKNVEK